MNVMSFHYQNGTAISDVMHILVEKNWQTVIRDRFC